MKAVKALLALGLAGALCFMPGPTRTPKTGAAGSDTAYHLLSVSNPVDGEPLPSVFELPVNVTYQGEWVVAVRSQGIVIGSSAAYRGPKSLTIIVDTKYLRQGPTTVTVELRVFSGPDKGRILDFEEFEIIVRNPKLRILEADNVRDHVQLRLECRPGDFFYMVWAVKMVTGVPQLWLGPYPTGYYLPITGGYVNVPSMGLWPSKGTLIDVVLRPPYYPGEDAMSTPTWFMLVTYDGKTWGHSIPRSIPSAP